MVREHRRQQLPLCGNVAGSRARLAAAFGTTADKVLSEVLARLRKPGELVEVPRAHAPVQEVVLTGDECDLTALPVHLQHEFDGAPYISASVDFVHDPSAGHTNVGMRRLMLRGRRSAGVDLVAPSDLRAIYMARAERGERTPVAFAIGSHPIDQLAATLRFPGDELALIAALRAEPLGVVKCVTNDLMVPADSQFIIEGYFDERGHVEPEGPFGEFLGYYGAVKRNPLFHLTAITHRRDAIFQTSSIGGPSMHCTDTAQLCSLRTEVLVWKALESAVREVRAVYAPPRREDRSTSVSRCSNASRAKRAMPSPPHSAAWAMSRMCSSSTRTSTSIPTPRWSGRWRRVFRRAGTWSSKAA